MKERRESTSTFRFRLNPLFAILAVILTTFYDDFLRIQIRTMTEDVFSNWLPAEEERCFSLEYRGSFSCAYTFEGATDFLK